MHDLLCRRRRRSSCLAPRPATTATISRPARRSLWVVLRPTGVEPPYELLAVTADPAEGEAFTEAGNDLVEMVAMPEPIREARCRIRRRAPCRAAVLQAQARPRRSGGARPARPRASEDDKSMSEREPFPDALVAPQAGGEPNARPGRAADAGCADARRAPGSGGEPARPRHRGEPSRQRQRPFDPASLPPLESIDAGTDIRAFLARGRAGGADAGGAAPRMGGRSRDPRLHRPRRKCLGLHRAGRRARASARSGRPTIFRNCWLTPAVRTPKLDVVEGSGAEPGAPQSPTSQAADSQRETARPRRRRSDARRGTRICEDRRNRRERGHTRRAWEAKI